MKIVCVYIQYAISMLCNSWHIYERIKALLLIRGSVKTRVSTDVDTDRDCGNAAQRGFGTRKREKSVRDRLQP